MFRERALNLVALLRKENCNLRRPMHLRHPVERSTSVRRHLMVDHKSLACSLVRSLSPYTHTWGEVWWWILSLSLARLLALSHSLSKHTRGEVWWWILSRSLACSLALSLSLYTHTWEEIWWWILSLSLARSLALYTHKYIYRYIHIHICIYIR